MKRIAIHDLMGPESLSDIKRSLLFFDSIMYDNSHLITYTSYLKSFHRYNEEKHNELLASIQYLENENVLEKFEFTEVERKESSNRGIKGDPGIINFQEEFIDYAQYKKQYVSNHPEEIQKINFTLQQGKVKLNDADVQNKINAMLESQNQLGTYSCRLISMSKNLLNSDKQYIPIIKTNDFWNENIKSKKVDTISMVLGEIPVPKDNVPYDEILDFRKSTDSQLKYGRLISWINKIAKGSLTQNEIEEELIHLMNEYKNSHKLLSKEYTTAQLDATLSLPLEIIENIIKIKWSKLPSSFLKFRQNKTNFLIKETKAVGKEISYIKLVNDKFGSNSA